MDIPWRSIAAVLLLLTPAQLARADVSHEHNQRDGTVVRMGTAVGFNHLSGAEILTLGGHVAVGRRFGRLSLYGEYDAGKMEAMPRRLLSERGQYRRAGATLRVRVHQISRNFSGPDTLLVFWVEAGVGRQIATWDEGGSVSRNDVAAGGGWTLDHRLRPLRMGKPAYIGWHFGWRLTNAQRTATVLPAIAACDGPGCPSPERGVLPYDVGLVVTSAMTLSW